MDDFNRSISKYIESGQYFLDARKWYANRFISPATERIYIMLFLVFFVMGAATLGFYYQLTNPAPPEVTYVSPSEDIAKSYSVIVPAGESLESPQTQVVKRMLETYVERRESYDYNKTEVQLNFVRNNTVRDEYLKYENATSINNPSSPMMLYQDTNVIQIKVTKVNILPFKPNAHNYQHAIVYFESSLRNIASNNVVVSNYAAAISFQIDDISKLIDSNAKRLVFLVSEYNLSKVDKN
jgi:type IV secretion system protein VirB8